MKILKYAVCLAALAAMIFSSSFGVYALQEEGTAKPGTELTKNFFFNRDMEFRSSYSSDRMYITVDDHWKVSAASLNLSVSVSELAKSSALTVYVNDKPVHSEMLRQTDEKKKALKVDLPIDALKKGSNEIRLEVAKTEGVELCADDQRDGVWVMLYGTSYVHLNFEERAATNLLNEYPYPFLKASRSAEAQSGLIMIPDQADEEETAAALQIAASLGARGKDDAVSLKIIPYSQAAVVDRTNNDIIFVGETSHMPAEILAQKTKEAPASPGEGALLFRTQSPYNSSKVLMVISSEGDGGMLDMAARLLLNQDMTSQLNTNMSFIPKGTDVTLKENPHSDQVSLKDLGYKGGLNLKGPNRQQTSVGIKLPSNRMVVPGAKTTLHIRYAKNIDFSQSLVTVYMNGTPAGSKKLELEKADGDTVEVNIPNNAATGSYMELKIAFDLKMTNLQCSRMETDTPWGFVDEDSSIYLPTKDERGLLLENYPWPFIKDGRWNETAVVLPDSASSEELAFLGDLFAYMGQHLRDNTGSLRVVKNLELTDNYRNTNFILVGTPERIPAIKTINDNLWFKYDGSFGYFLSNEKRRLLESFSRNLASVQLIASPLNSKRGILVVTAPKPENLVHAEKYLTVSKYASTMVGNALLANSWENVTNHYFIKDDSLTTSEKISLSSPQLRIFAVMFGTILLMIAIGGILYFRKYRRR